jgi:hypothetical protein
MTDDALPQEVDSALRETFSAFLDASRGGARNVRERLRTAVGALLDRLASTIVNDPLDIRNAEDAQQRIDVYAMNVGNAATIIGAPWFVNRLMRLAKRGTAGPSTAAITATAATGAAIVAGVQHLRVLGSLLVHRLIDEGHRIDPAFVRRVTVALYLDPTAGANAARPSKTASIRLSTEWASHAVPFLRARKTMVRVHRAAEAIDRLDLDQAMAYFERENAIDLRATRRSG